MIIWLFVDLVICKIKTDNRIIESTN